MKSTLSKCHRPSVEISSCLSLGCYNSRPQPDWVPINTRTLFLPALEAGSLRSVHVVILMRASSGLQSAGLSLYPQKAEGRLGSSLESLYKIRARTLMLRLQRPSHWGVRVQHRVFCRDVGIQSVTVLLPKDVIPEKVGSLQNPD